MGDYDETLPLYQRSLDIREKVLELQHQILQQRETISELYYQSKDCEKALPLYRR
ncbi:MAG TPA: tetratricopeptide repeat protein [Methanosarcina sp.]|nr:tetratricopeptide repeat protein [Methanosarcina sp.]